MSNQRITIRLGTLARPLVARAAKLGITPVELTRRALAEYLGKQPPEIKPGNPDWKKQHRSKS